ncbi:hypothetical protein TI03_04470 [Achromatium sp. WMS1]|nr:hypothetical protein TI03_04470 [Achromatium sp. WMS1]
MLTEQRQSTKLLRIHQLLKQLLKYYGPQNWWPADSPFEVMVGAILTQNTAWTNVVKAITQLKARDCLTVERMAALNLNDLATLLRSAGYYNVKAQRLYNLCQFILEFGGVEKLDSWETDKLRLALLQVNGIGPETADDILLYAFARPVFVVDTYTRRIGSRLGLFTQKASYETIRALFETALKGQTSQMNELHALLVRHAKQSCRKFPQCIQCILKEACPGRNQGINIK